MRTTRRTFITSTLIGGALATGLGGRSWAANYKVAIVMPGNITDQAWNQAGYEAMLKAKEKHGIEIAYSEKVAQPDQLEAMSDYARRGYNLVIGHGGEFVDATKRAAARHPNTMFLLTNGFISDKNLASLAFQFKEFGYVLGFLAGRMNKTGKVGFLSGQKIKVATEFEEGYRAGYKAGNPKGEIVSAWTNDWDDVAKGKEATLNLINQGADIVFSLLDNGQIGSLQACQQKKAFGFGIWTDMYSDWKDTVLQSAVMNLGVGLVDLLQTAKEGKLEGKVYYLGIGSEAGHLGTFNPAIPQDVVKETEDLVQKIKAGTVKV